jgi:hypothetical protein
MKPDDNDPKMLDRDLRDFPVPPPPAGLLEKIQAEIPDAATLAGENVTATAAPRRWPLRLAATIALAVVGATVAWQSQDPHDGGPSREFSASGRPVQKPPGNPAAATGRRRSPGAESTSSTLTESFSAKDR